MPQGNPDVDSRSSDTLSSTLYKTPPLFFPYNYIGKNVDPTV